MTTDKRSTGELQWPALEVESAEYNIASYGRGRQTGILQLNSLMMFCSKIDPGINGTVNFYAQTCSSDGLHQTIRALQAVTCT